MAVHFILLFCRLQRLSLFISIGSRAILFCPWLEALSASSTGALCVGLRSNPFTRTIPALTWELETHKMFYFYPSWHGIISACMSAYTSMPENTSSKATNGLPLVLIVCFSLWICDTCALASDVAVWKALPCCRTMPNKSVFAGWRVSCFMADASLISLDRTSMGSLL